MAMLSLIAFDADDTLWHNEILYANTQRKFREMLVSYASPDAIDRRLYEAETRNLSFFGYGIRGFTLSMIETAIELTGGQIDSKNIQAIINFGKDMTQAPVELLPEVATTVAALAGSYPLMLLTKGDLVDQETKLARSGLVEHFQHVEIVREKTPATYTTLLEKYGIAPAHFLMVGNSLKSDVLPVIDIGGQAVHIPYHITWAYEEAPASSSGKAAYHVIESIDQLPALVERLAAD
jgi:putative hydrolase of the HAD superfamily